jgi:hypothetical protein
MPEQWAESLRLIPAKPLSRHLFLEAHRSLTAPLDDPRITPESLAGEWGSYPPWSTRYTPYIRNPRKNKMTNTPAMFPTRILPRPLSVVLIRYPFLVECPGFVAPLLAGQ